MKFFWKTFFTTMFVSVTCLALGGYILISSNLNTTLDGEEKIAYDYADIAYYSLVNEMGGTNDVTLPKAAEAAVNTVSKAAQTIHINRMNQKVAFGVISKDGNVVYTSLAVDLDKTLIDALGDGQKGFTLKRTERGVYIQAIRPVLFYENLFYIETIRDVTYIFDGQKLQYELLLKIMVGTLFAAGMITFVVSKLLIRRVISLTKVTMDISGGDLTQRAILRGDDEIAALSKNFNRMADDLEEKIDKLQEEADKKELFVGAFSHELKTPLTSIIGYSDMLRRRELNREQLHLCAEYIFTEGKRLEALSMKLMDLIVLKNQNMEFVPIKIDHFLNNIASTLLPPLKEANIELFCDMEPGVVILEPDLMKTVFINIIDNGRKAIEERGSIYIKGRLQKEYYTVSIHDTGKGMEKLELSKIKEAFYMVDKSRSRKQGG
ncbi:MAG: HAMP domain-containing sensor histidine kinase, partial [Fibrobacter sp.]|nr:HAMP domain-containing sensor histidine kinase [Fibrobacter sp.]